MPVETDSVANAAGEHLRRRSVRLHPGDRGESWIVGALADVAGSTDRNVEQAIRTETEILPAVVTFFRQTVDNHGCGWRRLEFRFDRVVADDATDF